MPYYQAQVDQCVTLGSLLYNLMGPQNVPFLTHTCDKKKTNSACYPKANNSQNGLFLSPDRLSTPDGELLLLSV